MNVGREMKRCCILMAAMLMVGIPEWVQAEWVSAVGGDIDHFEDAHGDFWRVHTFFAVGSNQLHVTSGGEIEYLVVAGAGGGGGARSGSDAAGGGGGGGVLTGTKNVTVGTLPVSVGAGGDGGSYNAASASGEDSLLDAILAIGGGRGGGVYRNGGSNIVYYALTGGSGGGGFQGTAGADGEPDQGNKGGAGRQDDNPNRSGGGRMASCTCFTKKQERATRTFPRLYR